MATSEPVPACSMLWKRSGCGGGLVLGDVSSGLGLHDDARDVVADHVVHLPGDLETFVGARGVRRSDASPVGPAQVDADADGDRKGSFAQDQQVAGRGHHGAAGPLRPPPPPASAASSIAVPRPRSATLVNAASANSAAKDGREAGADDPAGDRQQQAASRQSRRRAPVQGAVAGRRGRRWRAHRGQGTRTASENGSRPVSTTGSVAHTATSTNVNSAAAPTSTRSERPEGQLRGGALGSIQQAVEGGGIEPSRAGSVARRASSSASGSLSSRGDATSRTGSADQPIGWIQAALRTGRIGATASSDATAMRSRSTGNPMLVR